MGIGGSSVDLHGEVVVAIALIHESKLAPLLPTGERDHDATRHMSELGEEVRELDERVEGRCGAQDHSPRRNLGGEVHDPLLESVVDRASEAALDCRKVVELLLEDLRDEAPRFEDFEEQCGEIDVAKGDASRCQEVDELVKMLAEVVLLLGGIDNEDA